ncbi:E3 ubiquitin-protein ligase [Drechslerella dactyloides]|uniref:E3 ubiquitin-protein ligase n=1 Tax=Drechslerella dactyloides TaxID=74499 RepID=A0AAD6NIT7_DREDA|nr:E3 ubiquitin-protein ligase [Drechslerella dactyloides]
MPPRKSKRIANAAPPKKGAPAPAPGKGTKRKRQDIDPPAQETSRKRKPKPSKSVKPNRKGPKEPKVLVQPAQLEEPEEPEAEELEELEELKVPRKPEEPPRLKRFRPTCPQAIAERWDRMRVQRMFCLGRQRDENNLTEEFKIAGSTGNVYTVVLANLPTCDCPDSRRNGTCKHILFVMSKVLKVRTGLAYQAALLNSEIKEIFDKAPVLTADTAAESNPSDGHRQRKPLDQDECPVCYEAFGRDETDAFYCAAQCGSNIHKECFRQWAASRGSAGVTCVMCRAPWQDNGVDVGEYSRILQDAKIGAEGYLNVADQMGLSHRRGWSPFFDPALIMALYSRLQTDTSTYYNRFYDSRRYRWL